MWSLSPPVLIAVAGAAIAVSLASGATGYKLGRASGDKDVRAMYEAGQKAMAKRQTVITDLRGKSREDADRIAKLSRDARVYCASAAPANRLPGTSDPGPAGNDRTAREDFAPVLRQCLRSFGEINRAVGVVK